MGLVVVTEFIVEPIFCGTNTFIGETSAGNKKMLADSSDGRSVTARFAGKIAFPPVVRWF